MLSRWLCTLTVLVPLLALMPPASSLAQSGPITFPETGKTLGGRFLQYWQQNGGLAQQGFPITDELSEQSPTDGKTYTVQYFERAVFEYHPENQPPNDVLLSLLGVFFYKERYPIGAPNQKPSTDTPLKFVQTGKVLGGAFRQYWERNGGVRQQGFPISDEFQEISALDGKIYTVQYFERAVFEYHPENPLPYDVLLSQLGTLRLRSLRGSAGLLRAGVQFGGVDRPVLLFIPRSYQQGTPVPLVLVLHGAGGNGKEFYEKSPDIQQAAEREGFIAVYPTGLPEPSASSNPNNTFWGQPENLRYIPFLMDYLQSNYSIEAKRIYIVGFSAGARLTYNLAADPQTSQRIAAIGTVAGEMGEQETPTSPMVVIDPQAAGGMPMSAFLVQGGQDDKLPIDGGPGEEGKIKLSFEGKVELWVKHIGGVPVGAPEFASPPPRVRTSKWTNPQTGYSVVALVDPVLAHHWPPWDLMSALWDFFKSVPTR